MTSRALSPPRPRKSRSIRRRPRPAPLLAELLCFTGDLERADKHLDAIGQQDAEAMLAVAALRQLVRAELSRKEFSEQGRVPEFLDPPPPHVQLALEASIAMREGKTAEAAAKLAEAEQSSASSFRDLRRQTVRRLPRRGRPHRDLL